MSELSHSHNGQFHLTESQLNKLKANKRVLCSPAYGAVPAGHSEVSVPLDPSCYRKYLTHHRHHKEKGGKKKMYISQGAGIVVGGEEVEEENPYLAQIERQAKAAHPEETSDADRATRIINDVLWKEPPEYPGQADLRWIKASPAWPLYDEVTERIRRNKMIVPGSGQAYIDYLMTLTSEQRKKIREDSYQEAVKRRERGIANKFDLEHIANHEKGYGKSGLADQLLQIANLFLDNPVTNALKKVLHSVVENEFVAALSGLSSETKEAYEIAKDADDVAQNLPIHIETPEERSLREKREADHLRTVQNLRKRVGGGLPGLASRAADTDPGLLEIKPDKAYTDDIEATIHVLNLKNSKLAVVGTYSQSVLKNFSDVDMSSTAVNSSYAELASQLRKKFNAFHSLHGIYFSDMKIGAVHYTLPELMKMSQKQLTSLLVPPSQGKSHIIKLDVLVSTAGRILECSSFYIVTLGNGDSNQPKVSILELRKGIAQDGLNYGSSGNVLKELKRCWSQARLAKQTEVMKKLLPFLQGGVGQLNVLMADVESCILLLEKERSAETIQDVIECISNQKQEIISLTSTLKEATRVELIDASENCITKLSRKGSSLSVQLKALQHLANEFAFTLSRAYSSQPWQEIKKFADVELNRVLSS